MKIVCYVHIAPTNQMESTLSHLFTLAICTALTVVALGQNNSNSLKYPHLSLLIIII